MAQNYTSQIQAIVTNLEDITEKVVTKITLDVTANLIETTPVDTGWARANWVPAIGSVNTTAPSFTSTKPSTSEVQTSNVAQQSATVNIVTSYTLPQGKVFISNNVPYIIKLNNGSSKQAPAGFVQRAIKKAILIDIRGLAS